MLLRSSVYTNGFFLQKTKTVLKLLLENLWVDKGGKFYNRSMESRLQENDIEI